MFSKSLIHESLRAGWVAFKVKPRPIIASMAGLISCYVITLFATNAVFGEKSGAADVVHLIGQVVFLFFSPGFQLYFLKAESDQTPEMSDLVWGWKYPFKIVLADILSTIPLLFLGLIYVVIGILGENLLRFSGLLEWRFLGLIVLSSLVVAGLMYFYLGVYLWTLVLVDGDVSPLYSVKASWRLMKGQRLNLFVLLFVIILLNIFGLAALIIGLLVTVPLSLSVTAAFYLRLQNGVKAAAIASD